TSNAASNCEALSCGREVTWPQACALGSYFATNKNTRVAMAAKTKNAKRNAGENALMPRTSPCKFSLAARASGRKSGKVFAESALGVEIPMVHAYVAKASATILRF